MAKSDTFTLNIGARTTAGYNRTMRQIQKGFQSITGGMKLAGKLATASITGARIIEWGKDAVETYKTFESSMKNTAAIMNASVMEYEMLEKAAREAGRTTTKTASEAADALGYMALAGWDAENSVKGLMPILRLAESTGKDLQTTSDLVTDSMSALGLSVEELDSYMDKLVMTNNSANTSAEQLMYALVKSGGAARVMGVNLDDTIAALGVLANNGLKSSEAGTALNSLMKRWGSNTAAKKAFDELGISLYDVNDQFIGMEDLMQEINASLEGKDANMKNNYMSALGGRFLAQLQYLLDSVKTTGDEAGSTWDTLTGKIKNSNGALEVMNKTATSSLEASQKLLKSAFQDLQISAVDVFADDFKEAMQYLAKELPNISDRLAEFEEEHHDEIVKFLDMAAEGIIKLANVAIDFGDWILDNGPAVEGIIATLITGKALGGIAQFGLGLKDAAAAAGGLAGAGAMLGPATIGIAVGVAAIAALTGGVIALRQANKKAREEAEKSSLEEHFGKIALSATDIEQAANKILGAENMAKVNALSEQLSKISGYVSNINNASDELSRLNWKISAGLDLNENDKSAYQEAAATLVKNVQEYISDQGYSVSLASSLLTGNSKDKFSSDFWNYQSKEATKLGNKLDKAIKKAMKDGVIDPDKELPKIQKLQQALLDMQQEMEAAKYEAELGALEDDIDSKSFEEIIERTNELQSERLDTLYDAYLERRANLIYQHNKGAISDYEYNSALSGLETEYDNAKLSTTEQTADALFSQIKKRYSSEISTIAQGLNLDTYIGERVTSDRLNNAATNGNADLNQILIEAQTRIEEYRNKISDGDRDAINKLLEDMLPTEQQREEIARKCREAGEAVPQSVMDGIKEYKELKALTGSDQDIWDYVYEVAANNENYQQLIDAVGEDAARIPEGVAKAMSENYSAVDSAVDRLYTHTKSTIDRKFSTDFNVRVKTNFTIDDNTDPTGLLRNAPATKLLSNAEGGIYNSPILTTFAEEGAEAAIPLNSKPRSVALWQKAGEMMGITGGTSNVNYSPQIVIQGNASKEDIVEAQEIGLSRFKTLYKEMMRQEGRVSFARA